MYYDKSDSDNFPESCCVEVLNLEKKLFKWCKISIHHDDFTQKEKFPAQTRSRWSWGRWFCAIFAQRIISESGMIFFMCVCLFWPNPLCLIFHHGRLLFTTPGLFKPLTFPLFWSILVTFWVNFRKVWTLGQSNDVSTMGVTLYYFPLRYCVITKSLKKYIKRSHF